MRYRQALKQGWYVKQLDTDTPDVEMLIPDETWLSATMPAQVHDILFSHGLIPDPRVGKNAAESAWVGEAAWAYAGNDSSDLCVRLWPQQCALAQETGSSPIQNRQEISGGWIRADVKSRPHN